MESKKYQALREDKEIAVKFLAAIFKEKKKRKKSEGK